MNAVKEHFANHRSHLIGCGVAALLVIAGIAFSVPALAIVGVVVCGSMMVAMVWMIVSMSSRHG
jgi:hypothetical protein